MFQYFVPTDASFVALPQLVEAGLGYAFEGDPNQRRTSQGPSSEPGVVVSRSAKPGYYPDRQTWRQIPGAAAWVGVGDWNIDDLARQNMIDGDLVEGWVVPKARRFEAEGDDLVQRHLLPRRLTLTDDGYWAPGEIKPRFRRLWELAVAWQAQMIDGADAGEAEVQDLDSAAIEALKVNYFVGPAEIDLLGIYDVEFAQHVMHAVLDMNTLADLVKKKAVSGPPSG